MNIAQLKKVFICSTLIVSSSIFASNNRLNLSASFEQFSHFEQQQGNGQISGRLGIEHDIWHNENISLGIDLGLRTGFEGLLDIPDDIQEEIGGPTILVHSGPRLSALAMVRKNLKDKTTFFVVKCGAEASVLNFGRSDIDGMLATNMTGQIGLNHSLSSTSEISISVGASKPLRKIQLESDIFYETKTPYTNLYFSIGWLFHI